MGIQEGLYRVTFGTPLGSGNGVAYLADGKLNGGDTMMAYSGTYDDSGENFTAQVRVFQHSKVEGMVPALGTTDAQLRVSGTVSGETVSGTGSAPQAPGVQLQVRLEKLRA